MSPCCPIIRRNAKLHKEIRLAILGLDKAGKTTTTRSIKGIPSALVAPTIGFDCTRLVLDQYDVTIYDLGGGHSIRKIWQNYFAEIHGVIFVVDSVATDRLLECRCTLENVLANPWISGKPVLLLANKHDVPTAISTAELAEALELERLMKKHNCPYELKTCCALLLPRKKIDHSIIIGLKWLLNIIQSQISQLEARIKADISRKLELEALDRKVRRKDVLVTKGRKEHRRTENLGLVKPIGDSTVDPAFKSITEQNDVPKNIIKRTARNAHIRNSSFDFGRVSQKELELSRGGQSNLSRKSLPIKTDQTPKAIIGNIKRQMKLSNDSTKSADSQLPPIPNYTLRNNELRRQIEMVCNLPLESSVRSDGQPSAEVMQIVELDEAEINQVEQQSHLGKNSTAKTTNLPPVSCKNDLQSMRLSVRPRTRRIAPLQTSPLNEKRQGKTPLAVDPLYRRTVAKSVKSIRMTTSHSDGEGSTSHVALSSAVKRPSPLVRIFTPNINKLHPVGQTPDNEQ